MAKKTKRVRERVVRFTESELRGLLESENHRGYTRGYEAGRASARSERETTQLEMRVAIVNAVSQCANAIAHTVDNMGGVC